MDSNANDKTVVITGGGRGIGAEISQVFYKAGYQVIIGSRTDSGLAGTFGEKAMFFPTDVRRPSDLAKLVEAAIEFSGRLDVMINNAGYSEWRLLTEVDEPFWDDMIDTNLKGVFFGCRAAASHLGPGGSIVNISSLAGKRGSANNSVYCASKFGVNGLTQALAKELGPQKIRVNAVCPVYVHTGGLLAALLENDSPVGGGKIETYLANFAQTNAALQRLPTGEEIGRVCLFLASEAASAITGQCLNVDCGVMPQ